MHPIKRPKASDTEEDLLRQEEEFLKNLKAQKIAPAAKVTKVVKAQDEQTSSSSSAGHTSSSGGRRENVDVDDSWKEANADEDEDVNQAGIEHPLESVLFQVKERAFDPAKLMDFSGMKGLPKVPTLRQLGCGEKESRTGTSTKKKSLFARSFDSRKESKGKSQTGNPLGGEPQSESGPCTVNLQENPQKKNSIGEKIHPYLAGMSQEEILEEQRKLLERLDPKLVEFIKNRKHKSVPSGNDQVEKMDIQEDDNKRDIKADSMDESDLPINPKSLERFPGMDKVELPKLAWAGTVKENTLPVSTENKNARFNFDGLLVPESQRGDSDTYGQALHHHGDEMDRPGYTIEELLTLARSSNMQQRSVALDTLGNIYNRAHTGVYDEILERSIFNLLDYMEFIYVVRKGLDNTDSGSINSALFCLASLLYPEQEEACLDVTYLWPNTRPFPLLITKPDEVNKEAAGEFEMKDFECLQLDLLDFLINRSEILTRIEYLLTSKALLFNEEGIVCVLKILIRLARHSPSSVIQREKILKYIVENHISPNWMTLSERDRNLKGIPLVHGLKLIRILVESSTANAMKLYHNYSILPSLMSFLAYDQWREQTHVQDVENLVLESFKIWVAFLSRGIAIDEYVTFFPVIMQFLRFYGLANDLNTFDLDHSAHLFALLSEIICFGNEPNTKNSGQQNIHSHWDLVKDAVSLIVQHCTKILQILAAPHLQNTFHFDLTMLSLSKGLEFLAYASKYLNSTELSNCRESVLKKFTESTAYINLTTNLISHSVLLQNASPIHPSRYPSNFLSVNAVQWNGELNPLMRTSSPFYFLTYFIAFLRSAYKTKAFEMTFNSSIEIYLNQLQKYHNSSDQCDYFVRFELGCLYEILSILPEQFHLRFPVSYRALAEIPVCCSAVFKNLLRVSLESCCRENDIDVIYQFYLAFLLKGEINEDKDNDQNEHIDSKPCKVRFDDGGYPGDGDLQVEERRELFLNWTSKRTESHWIFHPLEDLYKRAVNIPAYVDDNLAVVEQEIRGCLTFILHCLRHYYDSIIQTPQDLVTVYCRICRTFMLGNPSIYIDEWTRPILNDILAILVNGKVLSGSSKCIFSKYKPSNSAAVTFYDFYSELAKEYFDNSYFNEVFASYLFLPLRASEDSKIKTCVWNSEYLHCVRLCPEKLPVSVQYLTSAPEKDANMLIIFTRLIRSKVITKERNPFLYEVAATHLRNSVEFMTDDLRKDFLLLSV